MKTLTKSNIDSIRLKELNNGYQYKFECAKTNSQISVSKERNMYNVKINHLDMIADNGLEWLQMKKLSTVKGYLKQLVF